MQNDTADEQYAKTQRTVVVAVLHPLGGDVHPAECVRKFLHTEVPSVMVRPPVAREFVPLVAIVPYMIGCVETVHVVPHEANEGRVRCASTHAGVHIGPVEPLQRVWLIDRS